MRSILRKELPPIIVSGTDFDRLERLVTVLESTLPGPVAEARSSIY